MTKRSISFVDGSYDRQEIRSTLEYASLSGPWKMEAIDKEHEFSLVLYPVGMSGTKITFMFTSYLDRNNFIKSLYSQYPVEQVGHGIRLIQSTTNILEETTYETAFSKTVRRIRESLTNLIEKIRDSVRSHKEMRSNETIDEKLSS